MLSGKELIKDINGWQGPANSLAFWWLGQASVILKLAGKVVYIDPFLSPHPERQVPPLLDPDEVTNADLVLCTHDHADHIDPDALPAIAAASAEVVICVPESLRDHVVDLGIAAERVIGLDDGQTRQICVLSICAIKAKHEFFDVTAQGTHPYLSYMIQQGKLKVYHSGDGLAYDGLVSRLMDLKPTVMFVPINGRDAKRYLAGCIGNMTYQEAVDLVGEVTPRLAVPIHYDMFAANSEDPQLFVDYLNAKYPGINSWVGSPGQQVCVEVK